MSFDRHLGSAILDFTFFLKSQQITEIDTKSSQNAYYMYKLVNFWNLMNKNEKQTTELCQKKVDFWASPHQTRGCYGNFKNDGHTIDISKYS